ncbi:MAG TPA: hypothetical protein PLG67_09855 [Bacillota bacterium]|jgi:peptidoglycan hydrolase CwlO-like protein|nr:hypothetical protein [Bacillota bacterium]HRS20161.1 hypothetical protein [Clostridia bacterium]HRU40348.1 hypothetical protein [Candidatus Diapherotrites archaeon]HOS69158.1 hypothetical protein [Bacillota bacterium]HQE65777.1 hypothetical protein [Bacillota bacterium]
MSKLRKVKAIVLLSIAITLAVMFLPASAAVEQQPPFSEVKEKLSGITEEEKEVLRKLFMLAQEIETAEAEVEELANEIEAVSKEIKGLEDAIAEEELAYEKNRESLEQVLKSYQRMGAGSFLKIILDSDSLSTFLHRVNTLRDLTKNTGTLLEQLESSGRKLAEEKSKLSEKLVLLKDKQSLSRAALADKNRLRAEKEAYLVSLKGEKEYYQEYLSNLERAWNELKPLLSETAKEFSRMIEDGGLPFDALKISFSLFEIKGAIDDRTINKIIAENANLEEMIFAFHQEAAEIRIPDKNLILTGTFVIQEGHTLKFLPQEGSFFELPLEKGVLEELFGEEGMVLNLEPLLAGNDIHTVRIKEGYIELIHRF